jgi:DNA polymerase-1
MNAPIQVTAADIMKLAMLHVEEALIRNNLKSKLILQVHDELLIETAIEEEEQVRKILHDEMMEAANLAVRLEIDIHAGKNWYEAK